MDVKIVGHLLELRSKIKVISISSCFGFPGC